MKIVHDNICEIIFCKNIFFFLILHSEERWRRKLHYQINHIKNISSSNYISFHITQNITHKVDINEMRKKSENVSFFFCLFLLTLYEKRFVQLSIYKVMTTAGRQRNKFIDLWLFTHYSKQGYYILMTQVFLLISNFLFKVIILQ